jgi:hypothetical protein
MDDRAAEDSLHRLRGELLSVGAAIATGATFKDSLHVSAFSPAWLVAVPAVVGSLGRIS